MFGIYSKPMDIKATLRTMRLNTWIKIKDDEEGLDTRQLSEESETALVAIIAGPTNRKGPNPPQPSQSFVPYDVRIVADFAKIIREFSSEVKFTLKNATGKTGLEAVDVRM